MKIARFLVTLCAVLHVAMGNKLAASYDLDEMTDEPLIGNYPSDESCVLDRDSESGCLCRHYLKEKFITCYDPDTCKRFPRIRFPTFTIRISTTAIKTLKANDLLNNTQLTMFKIEGNDQFSRIEPGAFNGMSKLVNLSITHNRNLVSLEKGAFDGLTNLHTIRLNKNGFLNLKTFTVSLNANSLPKLTHLIITQMPFANVNRDDFEDLVNTTITSLNLFTCRISYIHPESLTPFRNLKTLGLGENNLNTSNVIDVLKVIVQNKIPLDYLSLFNLGFKELPRNLLEVIGKTNITHLTLTKNKFEIIEQFPKMPKITRLDLNEVLALNIVPNAFEFLPNLKNLYLSRNLFSEVPKGARLAQLKNLDISVLKYNGYSPSYFSLYDKAFVNMTNLSVMNLSGNNIRKLSKNVFIGLSNLTIMSLKNSYVFFIENSTFVPLRNLIYLDLSDNRFATRYFEKYLFTGLDKLEVLRLGHCSIGNLQLPQDIFENLRSLKHLGLENNDIKSLPSEIFAPLVNLEMLDLSNNNFNSWDFQLFPKNNKITEFYVSNNKIKNITKSMILDFNKLQMIELSKNPFGCYCSDLAALNEVIEQNKRVAGLLKQNHLNCSFPQEYANLTILEYLEHVNNTEQCVNVLVNNDYVLFIIMGCFLVMFVIIVMYLLRNYFYKCYIGCHKSRDFNKNNVHFEYDAFVSYSNEDHAFVDKLVKTLENNYPHYRLCVYQRDFQIGTLIMESISSSIQKSKKMLLIVSDAYIKSEWCLWEVQAAQKHYLQQNSLVIVKLGDVSKEKLNASLSLLMKTRIYLEWDYKDKKKESVFFRKLRDFLSEPVSIFTIDRNLQI
ncbi:PREDICTED: toll-like receptor 4 [Nicrophorus vespilloides]|uniref:Toll-like receptor 4 n=1 Tax=Nicrophorus vespilloides TaxID=110193 RepID=A0ABM1N9H4_NICVS|nr:PREDICTED: toll-like receptor 4 [Nicrophorus vespilloides]